MSKVKNTFLERASYVKGEVTKLGGKLGEMPESLAAGVDGPSKKIIRENILLDMAEAVKQVDSLRAGTKDRKALDINWGDFVKEKWGFAPSERDHSCDSFYEAIGVNPSHATVESLMTMPDFNDNFRWLIAEVIREAVRLGLRKNPLYPNLIAAEEQVGQPSVVMPYINMAAAIPKRIGEAETIPTGTISFAEKIVTLQKVGTGLKITDEVRQYVSLNVLALYLQDVGVRLNMALDTLCIQTLLNGDGNANPSYVIGVNNTSDGVAYIDMLRAWIRLGMLGRMPSGLLSNENVAVNVLQLPQFAGFGMGIGNTYGAKNLPDLKLRTPVPNSQNYDVHGAMPSSDQIMLIDTSSAVIKLNSTALRVESDRIAERQINGTYISLTTGFATLFDDARILIDQTLEFASNGFPATMDPAAIMAQGFTGN